MSDDNEDLQIGRIVISYYLSGEDAEPTLSFEFPDGEDVPMVMQIGMLEMAKNTLMQPEDDDE